LPPSGNKAVRQRKYSYRLQNYQNGRVFKKQIQRLHSFAPADCSQDHDARSSRQSRQPRSRRRNLQQPFVNRKSAEQEERIDRGNVNIKSALNSENPENRLQGQEQQADKQQIFDVKLRARRSDLLIKRQQQIQPDQQIEIPEMRPARPGKHLVKSAEKASHRTLLAAGDHIKYAKQYSEKHQRSQNSGNVPAEQLPV